MNDTEWDQLKKIQDKLHEALDKGYPPIGKGWSAYRSKKNSF